MTTETVNNPIDAIDKALKEIDKRLKTEAPKNNFNKHTPIKEKQPIKEVEKKKEEHKEKKYISFMKVAAITLVFALSYTLLSMLYFPNVYEVIATLLQSIFGTGFDDSSGLEHFVNN